MSGKQYLVDQAIILRNHFEVALPLRRLRSSGHAAAAEPPCRFLIIPADLGDPSGSMGDMAMLAGVVQSLLERNPGSSFTLVGTHRHRMALPGMGDIPVVAAWTGIPGTVAFDRAVRQHHALLVMGADILDGKYGAARVQRIVAYCNHSVRLGIPATMLGFSFNCQPRRPAVHALARLHPEVTVNLRDQPSLERFTRLVGIPARLCADSAFLIQPASGPEPGAEAWITAMRDAGRAPVGVNLNAHALAPAVAHSGVDALVRHIAGQLKQAGERNALAFMLIPHDLKPRSGDVAMLQSLELQLRRNGFPHVRYNPIDRPDTIKRIAGFLDLVITGRMHLAIASLGSGTPTLSITYQDKFEGLYQHFGLSLDHTIAPMQCLGDELPARIDHAYAQRQCNRELIRARLPQVLALSSRNLAGDHR